MPLSVPVRDLLLVVLECLTASIDVLSEVPQNPGQTPKGIIAMASNELGATTTATLLKVVSYLRVSGKGQVVGDGFPRQRCAVTAFAEANGMVLVEEFRDEGVSGTLGLASRPGLSALLESVTETGITTVLVEKADRIARDLVESELLLRTFREQGLRIIEADGGNDLTSSGGDASPTAVLIRQVLGAVAQFEKSALVAKLRSARDRVRRERGRCEGPARYGAQGAEAAGLQRLLEVAAGADGARRSLADIAATLNAEQVPTRTGRPWARSTVQALLARHSAHRE
jgi:DNA invertase Pin-like site-specific DNA recombinase